MPPPDIKKILDFFVGSHFVSKQKNIIYVWFQEYLYLHDKVCYVSHTIIE